jgi:hypothetical protein
MVLGGLRTGPWSTTTDAIWKSADRLVSALPRLETAQGIRELDFREDEFRLAW